jgi:hypothetical protein
MYVGDTDLVAAHVVDSGPGIDIDDIVRPGLERR